MQDNDSKLLGEAYEEVQEGFLDRWAGRAKSNIGAAAKSVANVGRGAGAAYQGAKGAVTGKPELGQQAASSFAGRETAATARGRIRMNGIIKTAVKDITLMAKSLGPKFDMASILPVDVQEAVNTLTSYVQSGMKSGQAQAAEPTPPQADQNDPRLASASDRTGSVYNNSSTEA
jgi:hypothetical protein